MIETNSITSLAGLTPALAAAAYASRGFRVVPLHSVADGVCSCDRGADCNGAGKHPRVKSWQTAATGDAATITEWFRRWPRANVGLAMGGPERVIALDVDGVEGRASLAKLEQLYFPLPETLTSRSGRPDGGEHRLFRLAEHHDLDAIKNNAGRIGMKRGAKKTDPRPFPALDIRGDGGQIVVCPSVHKSGHPYVWTNETPIAELPEWFYKLLVPPAEVGPEPVAAPSTSAAAQHDAHDKYAAVALERACDEVRSAPKGTRNDTINREAYSIGTLVGAGLIRHSDAEARLLEAMRVGGWDAAAIRTLHSATLRRALNDGSRNPRVIPELPARTTQPYRGAPPALKLDSQDRWTALEVLLEELEATPADARNEKALAHEFIDTVLSVIESDRTPEGARLVEKLKALEIKVNAWKMALRSRRKEKSDAGEATLDWRENLRRNAQGTLFANPANAITILRNEDAWQGVLAWDDFRNGIVFQKEAPWCTDDGASALPGELWSEDDDVRMQAWLMRRWSFNLGRPDCYAAARVVARQQRVHPVKDWLNALAWDGVKRLDSWLAVYLGVEPSPYAQLVGPWWMISAVARIFVPGCKADHALIFEGPQGIAKSTAAKTLFGTAWFSDAEIDWHSKDKYLLIRGRWGFELAELAGLGRADLDRVKAFMTQARDDYRGPYEKHTASIERQTVFVGTVNPLADGTYPAFTDPTGNRRWWPVRCGRIDLDALARDREQLWAEAVARYQDPCFDSHRWWPATPEERALCAGEQEQRAPEEVWQGKIEWWLRQRAPRIQVSVSEVLTEAIKREIKDCSEGDRKRAGICIARAGWVCVGRVRQDGVRERVYQRASEVKHGQRESVDGAMALQDTADAGE